MCHRALLTLLLMVAVSCSSSATFQLPKWKPDYRMNQSTIVMPCNYSGFTQPQDPSQFYGLIDIDWSNARAQWAGAQPMDAEEAMVEQAQRTKAVSPSARVFVYRNLVKALPWFSSVRAILQDAAYRAWFLPFQSSNGSHVPPCDDHYHPPRCSALYHDQLQTPQYPHGFSGSCPSSPCDCCGVPCGEYLFDHRASDVMVHGQTLRDWFIQNYTVTPTSARHADIDGVFIDDVWSSAGPSEMNSHCMSDMGLTTADAQAITTAWQLNMAAVQTELVRVGAFNWQLFSPPSTCASPAVQQKTCASDLRSLCQPDSRAQTAALLYGFTDQNCWGTGNLTGFQQDLANFLLDYGEPLGLCAETVANSSVFVRKFTGATVWMDCNKWESKIVLTP